MPKYRKPNFRLGGLEVRICGKQIQGETVCTLPSGKHSIHGAMASSEDGERIYAFLLMKDGDVQAWQLVGPPE